MNRIRVAIQKSGRLSDHSLELLQRCGLRFSPSKDKLFWYGSARYFETTEWDRVNKLGTPLPDEKLTGHELNGKVTATLGPKHLINVGYRDRPNERKNSGLGSGTSWGIWVGVGVGVLPPAPGDGGYRLTYNTRSFPTVPRGRQPSPPSSNPRSGWLSAGGRAA